MTIPADPEAISEVTDGVARLLRGKAWTEEKAMEVELALQEALANAIRHGCGGDPAKRVQCCVTHDASGEVVIVIRDPGSGLRRRRRCPTRSPERTSSSRAAGAST